MDFDIIWLNGTSSSGKTTLAKELQALLDDHFLHVCFDTFYQMLPARFKPTTPADSKCVERVHLGFEYSIPALAKGGNRLIVDYPFHYPDSLPRCLDLVSGYTVLYVGVFCPTEVMEQREAARMSCSQVFDSDLRPQNAPKNRLQCARWSPIYTAREIRRPSCSGRCGTAD
jgi:chloramphenicol 3-O-phosphotransferase